jgi:hypothetical protein
MPAIGLPVLWRTTLLYKGKSLEMVCPLTSVRIASGLFRKNESIAAISWQSAPDGGSMHAKRSSSGQMFIFMEYLGSCHPRNPTYGTNYRVKAENKCDMAFSPKESWVNEWRKSMDSLKKVRHISMYHG